MLRVLLAAGIGLGAGVASGAFGIGGALLTTPGIRLLMGVPALVAVGTPLPVIIPTAIVGVTTYHRSGFVDLKLAAIAAAAGCGFAVLGAYTTSFIQGELLLVLTAGLILVLSVRMLPKKLAHRPPMIRPTPPVLAVTGAVSGFVSGLLGLGGGLILVPIFSVVLRFPIKTALGTSLAVVAAQSIPGTIVHALLGNVDWALVAGLTIGVIPGARVGSRLAVAAQDAKLRVLVGAGMAGLALFFGAVELRALLTG